MFLGVSVEQSELGTKPIFPQVAIAEIIAVLPVLAVAGAMGCAGVFGSGHWVVTAFAST